MVMSAEQLHVSAGDRVSVSCNVSGHPQPELHWLNKQNGQTVVRAHGRILHTHTHTHILTILPLKIQLHATSHASELMFGLICHWSLCVSVSVRALLLVESMLRMVCL